MNICKNNKLYQWGKYKEESIRDNLITKTSSITTISEDMFYRIYLELQSTLKYNNQLGEPVDISITDAPIQLMSHILCKETSFAINFKEDNKIVNMLAKELDRTTGSIYKSYTILKSKNYLVKTEDNIIRPNNELTQLQHLIKRKLSESNHIGFDIVFKLSVGNDK